MPNSQQFSGGVLTGLKSTNSAASLTPIIRSTKGGVVSSKMRESLRSGLEGEDLLMMAKDFTEFTETVGEEEEPVENENVNYLHSEESVGSNDSGGYNDGNHNMMLLDNTATTQLHNWQGYYVLFVDPESFIYYRKDLRRDDYIVFEPFLDEAIKKRFF